MIRLIKNPLFDCIIILTAVSLVACSGGGNLGGNSGGNTEMELIQENEVVQKVLKLNEQLSNAVFAGDFGVLVEDHLSEDLIVSDPSNTIRNREQLVALFKSGQVVYSSGKVSVDLARQLGDLVVIMGTESTIGTAPKDSRFAEVLSGKTLHRRFTNVYRNEGGVWRLLIKQSTVFSIE